MRDNLTPTGQWIKGRWRRMLRACGLCLWSDRVIVNQNPVQPALHLHYCQSPTIYMRGARLEAPVHRLEMQVTSVGAIIGMDDWLDRKGEVLHELTQRLAGEIVQQAAEETENMGYEQTAGQMLGAQMLAKRASDDFARRNVTPIRETTRIKPRSPEDQAAANARSENLARLIRETPPMTDEDIAAQRASWARQDMD